MKYFLLALAIAHLALLPLRAAPTLEESLGAVDLQTKDLYRSVTGSPWNYVWRHVTVGIAFGRDGDITHSPWGHAVTWHITGPRDITIQLQDHREMRLHFNDQLTRWTCKDWSGDPAYGVRREPRGT